MNCSTLGLPVHHQLPEPTQTHVHWVSDAIQPSHPLSFPSPPALNLSQHQGLQMSQLFTSGGQSIGVSASTSVLPDVGKYESKRRRRWQRMRWLDSITNSMNMNLSKLQDIMKDRGAWHAVVHGVTKSWTRLSNWTIAKWRGINKRHWKRRRNPGEWETREENILRKNEQLCYMLLTDLIICRLRNSHWTCK